MAVTAPNPSYHEENYSKKAEGITYAWTTITENDTCSGVSAPAFTDRSIQVSGAFGGATVAIHGSNDGTNYVALTTDGSTACSFTAAGLKTVYEPTLYIKPVISGGTSQSLNITLYGRR